MIYAVVSGLQPGVYKEPDKVKKFTHGVKGSYVRNFKDNERELAEAFVSFCSSHNWKKYNSKDGFNEFLEWYEQSKKKDSNNSSQKTVTIEPQKDTIQITSGDTNWEIFPGKASNVAVANLQKELQKDSEDASQKVADVKQANATEIVATKVAEVKQADATEIAPQKVVEVKQADACGNVATKVADAQSRDEIIQFLKEQAMKECSHSPFEEAIQFMEEFFNNKEIMQAIEEFYHKLFKQIVPEVLEEHKANEVSKKEVTELFLPKVSDRIRVNVNPTDWEIFTDGSFFPISHKAGFAAILILGKQDDMALQISGGVLDLNSSYQAEEYAILKALEKLDKLRPYGDVHFYCDCLPLVSLLNSFVTNESAVDVSNADSIMREIFNYLTYRDKSKKYEFHHVPGHSGIKFNEKCDKIARLENELL